MKKKRLFEIIPVTCLLLVFIMLPCSVSCQTAASSPVPLGYDNNQPFHVKDIKTAREILVEITAVLEQKASGHQGTTTLSTSELEELLNSLDLVTAEYFDGGQSGSFGIGVTVDINSGALIPYLYAGVPFVDIWITPSFINIFAAIGVPILPISFGSVGIPVIFAAYADYMSISGLSVWWDWSITPYLLANALTVFFEYPQGITTINLASSPVSFFIRYYLDGRAYANAHVDLNSLNSSGNVSVESAMQQYKYMLEDGTIDELAVRALEWASSEEYIVGYEKNLP